MAYSTILIANRGEIACRILRTARTLGYRCVAVYSDADRDAPHVEQADCAVHIGPAPAADSYLNSAALLTAAKRSGAGAIHPGYGFLSENAAFARACTQAGLVFIGPSAEAIEAMGNKALAKRRMVAAGVPCVPGYLGEAQDDATLSAEAARLGYPLLVKAVAGGGGRGMRLVASAEELAAALAGARREALAAFGDGTLMLERLVTHARHIEIQVFADAHGDVLHLGERDCSTQRRRQKVIEESPSPVLTPALREAMGRDAVAAARAVGYCGAGTVEFIVDADLQHYFLEMNTRLQVEHPVTEAVTGLDLVEWQLRVAAGEPLPWRAGELQFRGHAIEARVYAEDPGSGFAPQTGTVRWWRPEQALRAGVRIDHGLREGFAITPFYDPMLAKVIAHGHHRDDAIRRLRAALQDAVLLGVRTNTGFLLDLLDHADFRQARITTGLLDDWAEQDHPLLQARAPDPALWCLAGAAVAQRHGSGWRADSVAAFGLTLACAGVQRTLRVRPHRDGRVEVALEGNQHSLRIDPLQSGVLRYTHDGVTRRATAVFDGDTLHLAIDGQVWVFAEVPEYVADASASPARQALAPVAGRVTQVAVAVGDVVAAAQPLVCVEAMKMEMWVKAGHEGRVSAVHVRAGDQVANQTLLVELDLPATPESAD